MPFKVTDAQILLIEADRIEALLSKKEIHSDGDGNPIIWQEADFIVLLEGIGLFYTNAQLIAVRDELTARGIIEIV